MKKFFCVVLACCLLTSTLVFATEGDQEEMLFANLNHEELKNLFHEAVSMQDDVMGCGADREAEQFATLTNENGDVYDVKFIEIPQARTLTVDSEDTYTYSKSYMAVLSDEYITPRYVEESHSKTGVWDSTGSVSAYFTIYWQVNPGVVQPSGHDAVRVSRVTGGWNISDKTVSVTERKVFVTNCVTHSGYPYYGNTVNYCTNVNSNTFDIVYGSAICPWVEDSQARLTSLGGHSEATLVRNSSKWSFSFPKVYAISYGY